MADFHFDATIRDKQCNVSVGVTRSESDDEEVQINIRPITQNGYLHLIMFLGCDKARELGEALIKAGTP